MSFFRLYIHGGNISQTFSGNDLDAMLKALLMVNENPKSTVTVEKDNIKVAHYSLHCGLFYCENAATGKLDKLSLGSF